MGFQMISGTARALPGRRLGSPGGIRLAKNGIPGIPLEITRNPTRNHSNHCPKLPGTLPEIPPEIVPKSASEWPEIQNRVVWSFEGTINFLSGKLAMFHDGSDAWSGSRFRA